MILSTNVEKVIKDWKHLLYSMSLIFNEQYIDKNWFQTYLAPNPAITVLTYGPAYDSVRPSARYTHVWIITINVNDNFKAHLKPRASS